jgi:hypothetical protein
MIHRRRALAALAAAALFIAGAGRARADIGSDSASGSGDLAPRFGENAPDRYRSAQRFNFELKFGPYSPNIDATKGLNPGSHPFADLFPPDKGKSRPPGRLLTQVELDYEPLHKWWGTIGIGHTVGFYRRTTQAFDYTTQGTNRMYPCTVGMNCVLSGDTTGIDIIPLAIEGVYRFDYFTRYRIPFVPYFKIGLAYYVWWIESGGGFFSIANYTDPVTMKKDTGFGGSFGWTMHPGGAFLLDVIDPNASRVMDAELGINHTYLFCEFSYADITGFGASGKMDLSDTTLNAGLSFQF